MERLGDWDEDDPEVLAWPWKDKEPVVADVDGQLRMYHTSLLFPWPLDEAGLLETLEALGEPSVVRLSTQEHRFDKGMFEDMPDDARMV